MTPLLAAATLGEALTMASRMYPGATTHFPGTAQALTCAELDAVSAAYAAGLRRQGVGRGDLVGLVQPAAPSFLTLLFGVLRSGAALFGVLRSGAAATVLPAAPRLGGSSQSIRRIGRIVESAGIRHLLIDPRYGDVAETLRSHDPPLTVLEPAMAGLSGRVRIDCSSIYDTDLPGPPFDAATLVGVIEAMPDLAPVLRKVAAHLKRSGRIYLSAACYRSEETFERYATRPASLRYFSTANAGWGYTTKFYGLVAMRSRLGQADLVE